MLPFQSWQGWKPFRLDALGIVTLLGAEEVNKSVGRLVRNRWFEYMPLLGAFVIAGDRISDEIGAGVRVYNLTNGFEVRSLVPWFERLIITQDLDSTRNLIKLSVTPAQHQRLERFISAALAVATCSPLLVLTILMADWWGLINTLAIIISILVRAKLVWSHRTRIDAQCKRLLLYDQAVRMSKSLLFTRNGRAVALIAPQQLHLSMQLPSTKGLGREQRPWFVVVQAFGWIAFATHVISLGMSDLLTQIYTVCLLVIPTVLLVFRVGSPDTPLKGLSRLWRRAFNLTRLEEPEAQAGDQAQLYQFKTLRSYRIGTYLQADIMEWPDAFNFGPSGELSIRLAPEAMIRSFRVQDLFAALQLSTEQIESMDKWDLLPHRRGSSTSWLETFQQKKLLIKTVVETYNICLPWDVEEQGLGPRQNLRLGASTRHGDIEWDDSDFSDSGHDDDNFDLRRPSGKVNEKPEGGEELKTAPIRVCTAPVEATNLVQHDIASSSAPDLTREARMT